MRLHRIGNALAPSQPGGHEVEGVPPVPARARAAPRSATAPAGNEQHVIGLPLGAVDRPSLTRFSVDLLDLAPQANGAAAVAGVLHLLVPTLEAVAGPLHRLQEDRRIRAITQGPEVGQVVGAGIASSHPRQGPLHASSCS